MISWDIWGELMKKSLALILLAAAALAQNSSVVATSRSAWIKFNPVTQLTAASFAKPPAADLPWVRMNLPATADPAEIAAEVRELSEQGIAGVEIGQGAFLTIAVRRALKADAARVSSWVGLRTSMPASCSTRSPISTR